MAGQAHELSATGRIGLPEQYRPQYTQDCKSVVTPRIITKVGVGRVWVGPPILEAVMSSVCIVQPRVLDWPLDYLRRLIAALGTARCRLMHRSVSRPVNGTYRCWICLREFPADW